MQGLKSKNERKGKTKRTDETEVVISHTQGRVPGFPPGDQVPNGHDMYYVHLLSREGMLETVGNYTHRI